jgi:hypothetical protein
LPSQIDRPILKSLVLSDFDAAAVIHESAAFERETLLRKNITLNSASAADFDFSPSLDPPLC